MLERFCQRLLLTIYQNCYPGFLVCFVFGLEMIWPIVWKRSNQLELEVQFNLKICRPAFTILTTDQIESTFFFGNWFYLACQQIHTGRCFRFVRMINVQKTVSSYSASSLLPHTPHFTLALFQQMARFCDAVIFVALQLMQRISSAFVGGQIL